MGALLWLKEAEPPGQVAGGSAASASQGMECPDAEAGCEGRGRDSPIPCAPAISRCRHFDGQTSFLRLESPPPLACRFPLEGTRSTAGGITACGWGARSG